MFLKIVVITHAGGAAKSTFTKNCLCPLIPESCRVSVEDWNSGDGIADLEISAKSFYQLAAQLNTDNSKSFIIDIGTSNSKAMFSHFEDLSLTTERIDFWVVPVRAGAKERIDTLKTIEKLMDIGVDPGRIVVIAQAVSDVAQFDQEFGPLIRAAAAEGFIFAPQAVLYNEVYNLIKGSEQNVFDIAKSCPDFDKLIKDCVNDESMLQEIGHQMLIYSLAKTAARNLLGVFNSTPLAALASKIQEVQC